MTGAHPGKLAYRLQGVGYRIGRARILEGITLDVAYGRVLCLVGPNGAGKSTLLGILSGDTTPTEGATTLDNKPVGAWEPIALARARSVLLQANQVAFAFTAGQVIEMGRAPWIGTPRSADDDVAIAHAIVEADVAPLVGRGFPTLSGGEKARVSLARVLAQDTSVVLWDEPTAALDLRHQEDVLGIARRLAAQGRAVVIVLHDLSLAAAYADEIAMIHHGRLVGAGPPGDVLTAARIELVYQTAVRVIPDPDTGKPLVIPRRASADPGLA
ncbi:MAG: heme ABC transporter ATP-binding protein [Bifidobacteriaceae bacterium]|jgi:iron complex transport system ATP-binding protein|nr:heme ABC transporter ATP-binding protein [Bifidobacteriaceae bacterium]